MSEFIPPISSVDLLSGDIAFNPVLPKRKMKHPKELFIISFYTMWVNFSFYGMKALLIAYIVTQLHLGENNGYAILGTYSALICGLPFIGGLIADKILGNRKAIIWGSVLQVAGHLTLTIPLHQTFFLGLALVASGSGFGTGPDNALVGSFYNNNDTRRKDAGFTLFYMIFNIGAALGGLLCGYVGQKINWHNGFGLAALFMTFGLINFLYGINASIGPPPDKEKLKRKVFLNISLETSVYLLTLVFIGFVVLLFNHTGIMDVLMLPLTILAFIYIIVISFRFNKKERLKLFAALILLLFTSFFWAFYEQQGGALNLFVIHNVNTTVGRMKLSGLAINNFFPGFWLIALTPVFIALWRFLYKRNLEPRPPIKFVLSFLFMMIYFLVLWFGCYTNRSTGLVPVYFIIIGYFIVECAEINLGPVSLSLASKLSPPQIASTMMGILYLSISLGEYFAGKIGSLMSVPSGVTNPVVSLPYYSNMFLRIAGGCFFIALLLLLLNPLLKKWMQEIR